MGMCEEFGLAIGAQNRYDDTKDSHKCIVLLIIAWCVQFVIFNNLKEEEEDHGQQKFANTQF